MYRPALVWAKYARTYCALRGKMGDNAKHSTKGSFLLPQGLLIVNMNKRKKKDKKKNKDINNMK